MKAPVYTPTLPEPEPIPCPTCGGEGGFEGVHMEPSEVCEECDGAGEIDVCPNCHMQPTLVKDMEVCGCTVAVFALDEVRAA